MDRKILVLVEGEKRDFRLMKHLFDVYRTNTYKKIVSYNTNIYELYGNLFQNENEDDIDLLMLLRSREVDVEKKKIFDERYTEIFLIFDFDPQDKLYDVNKLKKLMNYFNDSTENGRLYINYPMVESICHIKSWNESYDEYNLRRITKKILIDKSYKRLVSQESCCNDFRKYNKKELFKIIDLSLSKISYLRDKPRSCDFATLKEVLEIECKLWDNEECVSVLNTCILYFYEYYPQLVRLM